MSCSSFLLNMAFLVTVSGLARAADLKSVSTQKAWSGQRQQIIAGMERVMGPLPGETDRVPLDVQIVEQQTDAEITRIKLSYQSHRTDRVPAWLLRPAGDANEKRPAILLFVRKFLHTKFWKVEGPSSD